MESNSQGELSKETAVVALCAETRKSVLKVLRRRGSRPSPKTRRKYMQAYRRMRTQGKTPKDYLGSPKTYHFMRAAWTWGVVCDLRAAIHSLRNVRWAAGELASTDAEQIEFLKYVINIVNDLMSDLQRHPPDPQRQRRHDADRVGEYAQLTDGRHWTAASKRRELKGLPSGWRDQVVLAALFAESRYSLPIAVASAIGPRPAELAIGIRASLDEDGHLAFTIAGAKYRLGQQGQEWRRITCPVQALDTQIVRDAVAAAGGELLIVAPSAKGMWSAVDYFAKQAFPGVDHHISPYSMRHQVAADLKGEGWPPDKIAMALGHQTDRTCGIYGRPSLGKGARNFVVEASDVVRKTIWKKIINSRPEALASASQ